MKLLSNKPYECTNAWQSYLTFLYTCANNFCMSGDIKDRLRAVEIFTFSRHFQHKAKIRGISEEEVLSCLKNLQNLSYSEFQGDESQGSKYALLFRKSGKYDLKLVISIKDKTLNVVTAHIQNKKKRKVLEKWLKMRK